MRMGNENWIILEYSKYIKNADKLSHEDDLIIYNEIKKRSKFGGLVVDKDLLKTYPILKSINVIENRFPELIIKDQSGFRIYVEGDVDKLEKYIPIFTNLGYSIRVYSFDNVYFSIYLDPKYDLEMFPVPDILYYTADFKLKGKTSKIGFIPITGDKKSKHPDRFYISKNIEKAVKIGEKLNTDYCIYEIKGCNVCVYIDKHNYSYYIKNELSPDCFKIIEKNEK